MSQTWKPVTAGILNIVGGPIGILLGLLAFVRAAHVERVIRHMGLEALGCIWLVLGIMALAGGVVALKRKNWGLALTGAICAILLPGWLPGVLATIFLSLSKNEFSPASKV